MSDKESSIVSMLGGILLIVIVLTILVGPFAFISAFESVEAGTVRVITRFGGTTGRVLSPGASWKAPFIEGATILSTKKVIYETTTKENQKGSEADYKDYPVDTNTSDGQSVNIFYTVRFSVDSTKAVWIVQNIGDEQSLVEKIVKTESRIWVRTIPREFEAETLYTGSGVQDVQNRIFDKLQPVFEDNGLILDSIGIREIKFEQAYVDAIENKQIETVKVDTSEQIAARAEFEKQATIKQAEAQAESQSLQRESLSDQVIQKALIDRWDGHYPSYLFLSGGNEEFILPLPQPSN